MGPGVPPALETHPIMAIDGGARHTTKMDLWLGDGDSTSGPLKTPYQFQFPQDKDRSDLALGLSLLKDKLPYKLHLWGFLGGRRDHELFNLGEVSNFLAEHPGSEVLFYDDQGSVPYQLLAKGSWSINHHGIFSVGTFLKTFFSIQGDCRYPLAGLTELHPVSSLGLSNEAQGTLTIVCEGPIFIIFGAAP